MHNVSKVVKEALTYDSDKTDWYKDIPYDEYEFKTLEEMNDDARQKIASTVFKNHNGMNVARLPYGEYVDWDEYKSIHDKEEYGYIYTKRVRIKISNRDSIITVPEDFKFIGGNNTIFDANYEIKGKRGPNGIILMFRKKQ